MVGSNDEHVGLISLIAPLAIGAFSLVAAVAIGLRPGETREAAGVYPVWWSQGRALEAATSAGRIVTVGAAPFVVVVRTDGPGAAEKLRASGAWLVIDPGLATGCGA